MKTDLGNPIICYIDVGGTFTHVVLMDQSGKFAFQAVPSTPHNISEGLFASIARVSADVGRDPEEVVRGLDVFGFGATIVVNALLTRSGRKCGMIVTRGFEDILQAGRGKAGWCHLRFASERMHVQAHYKPEPLIPRYLVKGVSEGIDRQGHVIIPVYEHEARQAAEELVEQGVEAIVVLTLWDFLNNVNEKRIAQIVREIAGSKVDVIEAAEVLPIIREWPRACTAAIEAYTGALLSRATRGITRRLRDMGYRKDVLMMQSTGGVVTAEKTVAVHTVQSGPVGGLIGGKFIGRHYGFDNVVTTDPGGTSFDVGLVVDGNFVVDREPVVLNMVLGVPIAQVVSIGAGGGSVAGIDPVTGSFYVGPKSQGARPGPACYGLGGDLPTVTDADVVLGYLDPDYFNGGHVKLHKDLAVEAIKRHVAEPLGMGVVEAAHAIKRLIDAQMREALHGELLARGLDSRDFVCLAFGGAGASHVAGYTDGLDFREIMYFPYAAAFSAFGAASADIERTRTRSVPVVIPAQASDEVKLAAGAVLNQAWLELEEWTLDQLANDGVSREEAVLRHSLSMRYGKQIHDIIVNSPVARVKSAQDFDAIVDAFERSYTRTYSQSAKYARAGYEIYDVSVTAAYAKIKPVLARYERSAEQPPGDAIKSLRPAYFGHGLVDVSVYDIGRLLPGNVVHGPCIVEASTTTAVVPPDARIEIDEYLGFHLKRD